MFYMDRIVTYWGSLGLFVEAAASTSEEGRMVLRPLWRIVGEGML